MLCNIKNKQINECSCIMCPVEKIEPGPKSYDLIPHPSFMYFNKIKVTSSLSCILIKKKVEVFICFSGLIFVSLLNISVDILESGLWFRVVCNKDQYYLPVKARKNQSHQQKIITW